MPHNVALLLEYSWVEQPKAFEETHYLRKWADSPALRHTHESGMLAEDGLWPRHILIKIP